MLSDLRGSSNKYIEALIPMQEIITDALREKRFAYPMLAIRETVANALIYQDFSVLGVILFACHLRVGQRPIVDMSDDEQREDHAQISKENSHIWINSKV